MTGTSCRFYCQHRWGKQTDTKRNRKKNLSSMVSQLSATMITVLRKSFTRNHENTFVNVYKII